MSKLRISLILGVFLTASLPAAAQTEAPASAGDALARALAPEQGGLTAEDAVARALARAPSVAEGKSNQLLVSAQNQRTLSNYVPNLRIELSYTRINNIDFDLGGGGGALVGAANGGPLGIDGNTVVDSAGQPVVALAQEPFSIPLNNYALNLALTVPLSDYILALPAAIRSVEAADDAARFQTRANEAQVRANTKIAYYDWIRARAQRVLAEESLGSSRARLEDARLGLQAGTVAPADALALETLVASSETAVSQARSFERLAQQNLAILVGNDVEFTIGEDVLANAEDEDVGELDTLVEQGMRERPEMRAFSRQKDATVEAADGAAILKLPKVEGFGTLVYANPNQQFFPPTQEFNTSWSAGIRLVWNPQQFFQARSQERELRATARVIESQKAQFRQTIESEIRAGFEELVRAREALALSDVELRSAEATYEQRTVLFQGGEATSTEVIEAEVNKLNAALRAISARIDLRVARARLERAAAIAEAGADK